MKAPGRAPMPPRRLADASAPARPPPASGGPAAAGADRKRQGGASTAARKRQAVLKAGLTAKRRKIAAEALKLRKIAAANKKG